MSRWRNRLWCAILLFVSTPLTTGCAQPDGPTYLTINAADYAETFDAAIETARAHDFIATLRDRRHGVIETEPSRAGSVLEPWDPATLTVGRAFENTVSHQRRRVRFEFLPVGFGSDAPAEGPGDAGDDLPLVQRSPDLTTYEGELELRAWVYIERLHDPTVRRSTWSRQLTTRMVMYDPETGDPIRRSWMPTARDPAMERVLLARIERDLAK